VNRRRFILSASLASFGVVIAGWFALSRLDLVPLDSDELESRLRATLKKLVPEASGSSIARSAGWTRSTAFQKLSSGASRFRTECFAPDSEACRAHLNQLRDDDLRAGRVQWDRGWLLTETEIGVAVLLEREKAGK
jgi:hypothetical protein